MGYVDFSDPPEVVAPALIGCTLLVDGVGGLIVETEAYDMHDEASHTFRGETPRNAAMFGPGGRLYVYRSYGLHWCMNLVCREAGHGAGVLLRALEPTHGIDTMRQRRGVDGLTLLCSGPGRLAQALAIDLGHNGCPIDQQPLQLLPRSGEVALAVGPRIGISKAVDHPWRFGMSGSRFLSKPFKPVG